MNLVIPKMLIAGTTDVQDKAALRSILGAGLVANSTYQSSVTSVGLLQKEVITLTAQPVTVANATGASFGSVKIFDFPEGRILVLGVLATLSFTWTGTGISATGSGDYSIGTTATADATLATTDVDLLPSTAMTDPAVAGVAAATSGALAAAAQFDGTATAKDAYLNIIIDDAAVANADSSVVLVTGTITIHSLKLGDY